MGLFDKLLKHKKEKAEAAAAIEDDGQAKYFKDGEKPAKQAAKAEPKKEEPKKVAPKAAAPKAEPKKPKPASIPEDEGVSADDEEVKESGSSKVGRNGKFDVKKTKDGRYYFNLYASNKQLIANSQFYASSSGAINGIRSVMAHAPKATIEDTTLKTPNPQTFPKWEIYIDKGGEYRFRLYASNGALICHSHGYASKGSCKGGIESIQRFASEDADIDKVYLNK